MANLHRQANRYNFKAIRKFGSLGKLISLGVDKFSFSTHQLINSSTNWLKGLRVEGLNRKSRSLEVWKSRPAVKPVSYIGRKAYGLEKQTRRLSWDFACADFINPLSFQASRLPNFRKRCAFAFTMAEILISLTIIGVIAAITLPSLRANINEKTWATQKKALYSRMSQAIEMLPSLNGYGIDPNNDTNTANNAAQVFVTDGLAKVLNIKNICDNTHFKDCGIQSTYKAADGTKKTFPTTMKTLHIYLGTNLNNTQGSVSMLNTKAVAFETANGESVAVFYNPNCQYSTGETGCFSPYLCANFVVDLNGKKGPNQAGKDIRYVSAFYPTDSLVVSPEPLPKDSATNQRTSGALTVCRKLGSEYRLPTREEMAAIAINKNIFSLGLNSAEYITATVNKNATWYGNSNWKVLSQYLVWSTGDFETGLSVRCIKR